MLPKLLRKTLTFTAAFLDFSFLFQLLFVPMAFLASARPAIAETVPYLDISYDSGNSTFTFVAQPIKSLEYNVTYKPVDHDVEYNFGGTKSANAQGRVEFTQAAESQSGSDVITYEVESGHITVISTLRNNTQQTFSSSFVIENGEIEFFSAPQQPTGYWPQVAVDTSYISPENELVSVTFTSLPAQTGDLRVEEISLTEEQMAELGTSNNTAYEITSSMENGSFTYDLTLPNPTGSEDIQVQYSEDGETFEIADPDELTVEQKDDASVVTLRGLDHFTVFVVTGVDNSGSCVGASISVSGGDTCFTTLQSAIDAASSGDTISIHEDLTLTSPVNITKPLTIQGNGHTISPTFTGPGSANSNNAPLRISSQSDITINNLIINGVGGTSLHGISVFGSSNITLNDITSKDNDRSGIVVNGSSVTVHNVTTSGNGWHGINADRGSGLPNASVLTVTGVSKHNELLHIYIDNTDNGSVIDTENQYTSESINAGGTHPNDLLYTLIPPVKNIDTGETFSTIKQAVQDSDTVNGHTIEVKGSITVIENTNVNKDLTIRGVSGATISTSGTTQLFTITANGVTIENFAFVKTENANAQIFIGVQADDVTIQNNTFTGQFVLPTTGATSRAIVTSSGADNLLITGNSFSHLRQPAYLNNGSSGVISNNYVTNTRGWVVEKNSNFTFTGNTWGDNQDNTKRLDIAVIAGSTPEITPNNYTCVLSEIIANNNGAVVEDQYPGTCPDTTMPEMALISPTNGSIISGTYRFVVEASDESGITKILFNLNGTQYGSQLVKGDGDTWYVDIDTTTIPDGLHHVVLRVTDGAGNTKYWNNRKDIHSFTIDNTGPVAPEIVFPNPEQNFTTTPILNDWTDVTDPSGISHYRIEYQYDDGHTFANAPYREVTVSQRDHYPTLPEQGGVKIRVQAFDNQGNEGVWSDWRHYYYDATAPATPTITGFINPDLVCGALTTQSSITVDWTDVVDNESGLLTYEYFIDYPLPGGGRGEWTTSLLASQRSGELNEGVHHIKVRAKDKAGNVSPWSNICDITLDTTAPAAPTNGQHHNTTLQTNNFWFTWDEVTDSTPVTYEFQSSMNPTQSGGVLTTSLWKSGVLPGPTIHSVGAPDGTWYWQVRAIDAAGNVGPWSEIWNVTLDTQAPDVQITSPGAGETLLDTGIVEVTGTITDNLKLLRYYFTIRDSEGALATGTAPLLVNTSATSASLSYFWDTSLVEEGEYTLMLEARDAADNKDAGSVHAIKVMIERTPVASPSPTPSPTPSPSPSPEPTPEPSPSPEVSPSPEPTPTPEATPSPSPEPSPEPGEVLGTSTSSRGGSSSRSVKAPVCSEATPGAISNLLITTTASGATLSWTKPEGEISHYGLEFVRLDANGNETGRYGVAALGDSNTTSFTIDNLPGGSAYRFELFAVYKCAPGPRSMATSALITAPGAPNFESGEVIITPNTGEAEVLGTSTDEEMIQEAAENAQNDRNGSSFLGQVLGASTENCQPTSWWWIFLPGLLAGLALIHVLLTGKLRALVAALLLLGTGFGLYETNCAPWLWIGLATVMSLGSVLWSLLNAPRRNTKVPFSNLSRATKMKRS
jgi:hypothetical protein